MLLFLTLFASAQEALPTTEAATPPPIDEKAYEAPPAGVVHLDSLRMSPFVVVDAADRQVRLVADTASTPGCDARLVPIGADGSATGPERAFDQPVGPGEARAARLPDGADSWRLTCATPGQAGKVALLRVGVHSPPDSAAPGRLKIRRRVGPVYPEVAKGAAKRKVVCRVRIHADGTGALTGHQFLSCPELFHDAVDTALAGWAFYPAEDGSGNPVSAWQDLTFRFQLR